MDDFLRKLQLSELAIKIYLTALGKNPLTYYELYLIAPDKPPDEFNQTINELLSAGLLLQQVYEKEQILTHYYAIPPILPIINYYENIDANLSNIKNSIQKLLITSTNEIFKKNKIIELDSILTSFEEIKKDIDEDSIIQREEVGDIVKGMEVLKNLNKEIANLQQDIKSITQTKFSDLIKSMNSFKSELIGEINALEFKKHKKEIITIVENIFKEKIESFVDEFISNVREITEKRLKETSESFEQISNQALQFREDFKMALLNMLSNFEMKTNKIHELIAQNKDDLFGRLKNLEIKIVEKLNSIVQTSIDEVSSLNKPIEQVLKKYFQKVSSSDNILINKIWIINSVTKINEEIQKIITTAKENLTIIIPNLEYHIAIEQFKNIPKSLKIQIASSEPHTNSLVKKFKEIGNLNYKTFENENLIMVKGDNNYILTGIKQDSKDILSDFIGIGSNFEPFIILINPVVKALWEQAYSDTFYASQRAKTQTASTKPTAAFTPKTIAQKIPDKQEFKTTPKTLLDKAEPVVKPEVSKPPPTVDKESGCKPQEIPKEVPKTQSLPKPSPTEQIKDLKQKLQEKIEFLSAVHPQAGDKSGALIDSALDNLVKEISYLKGDEFSKRLQNIADIILEKKGFSVTLHKIRSTINKYKEKLTLLDEEDKKEIFNDIETWKQKLF